ncbi:MAG: NAD(P)/FAD-dependent oxidoreductase [Gemmataceae bacterium]
MAQPHKIVILGGGFAGMYAARRLDRTLARDPNIDITLVNRDNFFLFTPMLHEVATSDLNPAHIVNPIRKLLKRLRFFAGGVDRIDLEARRVLVSHGVERHPHELEYDHLVLALGSVTNFFDIPGLAQRAFTMKTLGDAIALRNHVIRTLEEADFECCAAQRDRLLTFVVAGGGFAGVETVGGLNDFVRSSLRFYPNLRPEMVRVVLVHSGAILLPELDARLGEYARRKLTRRGVEVRTGARVKALSEDFAQLSDGCRIPTQTLIWTAGTSPHPLLAGLECEKERGRIEVNAFLEATERPGVWALGDCAAIRHPKTGELYPPTAQHAVRQAKVLAHNLRARIRGRKEKVFSFRPLGKLATIGRRSGVATVFGVRFSGLFAWLLWRFVYLTKLPRLEKKLRVALDWLLEIFFSRDIVQISEARRGDVPAEEGIGPVKIHATATTRELVAMDL